MTESQKQSRQEKFEAYEKKYLEKFEGETESDSSSKIPPYEKSWAVIIGINNYQHVPHLANAVNDAKKFADLLRKIGFDEIIEIYNEDANRGNILSKFLDDGELPSKINVNDRIIIFFAGHGATVENKGDGSSFGYLIPYDAERGQWSSCIEFQELVKQSVKKLQAKQILFLMDCCFSGKAGLRSADFQISDSDSIETFVQNCFRNRAVQIIVAGQHDEAVLDESSFTGHSPFTGSIIHGIESNDADLNRDGMLTTSELSTYIEPIVSAEANVYGHKQKPFMNRLAGDEGGDFILTLSKLITSSEDDGLIRYEQELAFDEFLNDQREDFEIFDSIYSPSEVLKKLDKTRYEIWFDDWLKIQTDAENEEQNTSGDPIYDE